MKYDFEELMQENMNIQETPSEELKERILYYDKGDKTMRDKRKYWRYVPRMAAAALAAVVVTSGMAYAGSNLWNHFVAEDFGVAEDSALMKDLNDKGYAQQPQVTEVNHDQISVTDKDITVTLQQTLADEHSAYVCFEVKYGDQYHVVDGGVTEISDTGLARPEWVTFQMDSGISLNYSGSVYKIKDDHTILYHYFLTTSRMEDTLQGGKIHMSMSSFAVDNKKCDDAPTVIAEDGNWDLAWDLSVGTEKRVYHLDKTLNLGKYRIVLKDLEVSPLSANLTMQCPDDASLSEICAVVRDRGDVEDELDENGDVKIIRYVHTGGEEYVDSIMEKLPKGQTLRFLDSFSFCLGDKEFEGMGGMGIGEKNSLYEQFNQVLDFEKMTGIRVAGKYIDLQSVPYDIAP
ncbi:MAG: DUF4179 domain-containing protein [Lachnospiraceae bacterium]|nr:DUF4179 domain-containing protein [Lachnospiraceae bacterium]